MRTTVTLDPDVERLIRDSMRKHAGQEFRWDKALAVDDAIEDEELTRKLSLRKPSTRTPH